MSLTIFPSADSPPVPRYSVEFLSPDEVNQSPDVLPAWRKLLAESAHLYRLWQSPEWWDHLGCLNNETPRRLAVARDHGGEVVGVVPLQIARKSLSFAVRMHEFWRPGLQTIYLLGSQPLMPDDEDLYRQLFTALWDSFPGCDCVCLRSVIKGSPAWRHLTAAISERRDGCFLYHEEGLRRFHSITLPGSFEEYLEKFPPKRGQKSALANRRTRKTRRRQTGSPAHRSPRANRRLRRRRAAAIFLLLEGRDAGPSFAMARPASRIWYAAGSSAAIFFAAAASLARMLWAISSLTFFISLKWRTIRSSTSSRPAGFSFSLSSKTLLAMRGRAGSTSAGATTR